MPYNNTLNYYNTHAAEFCKDTVNVTLFSIQQQFLSRLEKNAYILDFGCGSGRDTKYFLEQGYRVAAVDGSQSLCQFAETYAGIKVRQMLFQELSDHQIYDGIWACSSILHLPVKELADVMQKMSDALKRRGIIYTSFKYGKFAGERNGRYFTDMTMDSFAEFLQQINSLEIEKQWVTFDVRPKRGDEQWLNLILRKR